MNSRAQSGLEYLMTYGWALIMVATIIGVLVFLVGTPTQTGFDCKSSDPLKIDFVGAQFDAVNNDNPDFTAWSNGKIILRNLTGGRIKIMRLEHDAYFWGEPRIETSLCGASGSFTSVQIAPGENFTIENNTIMYDPDNSTPEFNCDQTGALFNRTFGNIYITYLDQLGLSNELTLSCQNFPLA